MNTAGMDVPAFDTLGAARGLEAAGIEHGHAEAAIKVIADAITASRADLATKADIAELRAEFRAELAVAINKMLLSQIAVAGVLLAAIAVLKLF